MAKELRIQIIADGTQAKSELAHVEKAVQGVETGAATLDKTFAITGEGIARTLGGIGIALLALDLKGMANQAVDETTRIREAMQIMGVESAESVQKLMFAATQGGATMEALTNAVVTMSDRIADGKIGPTLEALGLSLGEIAQLAPDQAFLRIAEAIRQVPDPLKQADLTMDAFGTRAKTLLPAIRDGFAAVGAQAPLMSEQVVRAGDEVGDQLDKIDQQIRTLQAQALIPLVEFFTTTLPEGVQVTIAGAGALIQKFDGLLIAILALVGPGKALAAFSAGMTAIGTGLVALQGGIMTWLAGAGAGLATFFLTTLPAAFSATIAFLGPQGLIALAVVALGAVWYLWGDKIKVVVQNVYTAVKTWLVDKLTAIWNTVGQGIETVKGYFADLYEAVVGHSYVPDMVKGIEKSIALLDDVFVNPSQVATNLVKVAFETLGQVVEHVFSTMLKSATSALGGIVETVIPTFAASGAQAMQRSAQGLLGAFTTAFGAGMGQVIADIGARALDALGNLFTGGEEATVVNPLRDAFFAMFGGYGGLAEQLSAAADGNIADELIKVLFNADTQAAFDAAKAAIESVLSGAAAGLTGGDSPTQQAMDGLALSVTSVEESLRASEQAAIGWHEAFYGGILRVADAVTNPLLPQLELLAMALAAIPREIAINISMPDVPTFPTAETFHTGGTIPGRGERLARVLGGEGVVSHRGMESLERLNSGQGPASMTGVEQRLDRLTSAMESDRRGRMAEMRAMLQISAGQGVATG